MKKKNCLCRESNQRQYSNALLDTRDSNRSAIKLRAARGVCLIVLKSTLVCSLARRPFSAIFLLFTLYILHRRTVWEIKIRDPAGDRARHVAAALAVSLAQLQLMCAIIYIRNVQLIYIFVADLKGFCDKEREKGQSKQKRSIFK